MAVTVPAQGRGLVRFPLTADVGAGPAAVLVVGAAGAPADASRVTWPVLTPATAVAAAMYGELDAAAPTHVQAIAPPTDALPQFGGLRVSLATTALQVRLFWAGVRWKS